MISGMNLLGADYNIIARQCMEGLDPLGRGRGGRGTYSTGIVVPGQRGKSVPAKMYLCNSDQCNTTSFQIQATLITIFVSICFYCFYLILVLRKLILSNKINLYFKETFWFEK